MTLRIQNDTPDHNATEVVRVATRSGRDENEVGGFYAFARSASVLPDLLRRLASRPTAPSYRLVGDAIFLGVIGAIAASALTGLVGQIRDILLVEVARYGPDLQAPQDLAELGQALLTRWRFPIATVFGGLVSGLLVWRFSPESEGHGTDTVVRAIHQKDGYLPTRVAPVKLTASAITIGSGGAAGREGPTALITAAVAWIYGRFLDRSAQEKRVLVLAGMAAGLGAVFRAPLGSAIFAVEVLYRRMDFEADALVYTVLASVVGYTIAGVSGGWTPLFHVPSNVAVHTVRGYLWLVPMGFACGAAAAFGPTFFYRARDRFRRFRFHPSLKPALGGLGVGIIGIFVPGILGGGYVALQRALDGNLPVTTSLELLVGMLIAMPLTVASGGSGGVFAPTLFTGGMLGSLFAALTHHPAPAYVLVAMAGWFGAAARVPLAALLLVAEMTGGYSLLAPTALVVVLAYSVQVILTGAVRYPSLYEAQVPDRNSSPAHRAEALRAAFKLLRDDPARLGRTQPIDLQALILAGIDLHLADDASVVSVMIPEGSKLIGATLSEACERAGLPAAQPIGVVRDGKVKFAASGPVVSPDDRLILAVPVAERGLALERLSGMKDSG